MSCQRLFGFILAGVLLAPPAGAGGMATPGGVASQRASNLETFDAAWTIINESHWDPDFNGVDWVAVRDELRPQAAEAETAAELRAVISAMIARLDQSHFAIWPQGFMDDSGASDRRSGGIGHPGFATELVEGRFVVARVATDGPAAAAGVKPGWIVDSIEGEAVAAVAFGDPLTEESGYFRAIAQRDMNQQLTGPPGGSLQISFLDGEDAPQDLEVGLVRPEGQLSRFGNMPPLFAHLQDEVVQADVATKLICFSVY